MLSKKIMNVGNSLGMLAKNILNEDVRSFLAVCQSELSDAADLALELENTPMGQAVMAEEAKRVAS